MKPGFFSRCLFLMVFGLLGFGQTLSAIDYEYIPCNNFQLEFVETTNPNCGTQECNKMFFTVRLKTLNFTPSSGGGNPDNFLLSYDELSAVIKMSVTSGNGFSVINSDETENSCGEWEDQLLSVENGNLLSFSFFDPQSLPLIFYKPTQQANYWVCELFTIVVNAAPNEELTFSCQATQYTYSAAFIDCAFSCDTEAFDTPSPGSTETELCIQLGSYDAGTKNMPVQVKNNGMSARDLYYTDFTFTVTSTKPMGLPTLVNQLSGITGEIKSTGVNTWKAIIRYDPANALTINASQTVKLFDIHFSIPGMQSEDASLEVCLGNSGLMRTSGTGIPSDCRNACINGACSSAYFSGFGPCDPQIFEVLVEGVTPSLQSCSTLQAKVALTYVSGSTLDFDQIRIKVKFDLPGTVSISDITSNTFGCPDEGDCNGENGYSDCFLIDYQNNTVTFCYFPDDPTAVPSDSYFVVDFTATEGCLEGASVLDAVVDIDGKPSCIPEVSGVSGFPVCPPKLEGEIRNELNVLVDDVQVKVERNTPSLGCPEETLIPNNQPFAWCACDNSEYTVTPEPLSYSYASYVNGVTTYDYVLVRKHFAGLEFLDSPYKIIAADVDRDKEIAPADITAIRRMILGVIEVFPNNTPPWRYIRADYDFSDPTDPLNENFPEDWSGSLPSNGVDFVAVKIGDVNNTHSTNLQQRPANQDEIVSVSAVPKTIKGSNIITVPLVYEGEENIEAIQAGFRFDPSLYEWIGASKGELQDVTSENFGLTHVHQGEIRFMWGSLLPEHLLQPGTVMANLTFRRKNIRLATNTSALLVQDDSVLRGLAYKPGGTEYPLLLVQPDETSTRAVFENNSKPVGIQVDVNPNPAQSNIAFRILPETSGKAELILYTAFGMRRFYREINLEKGIEQVVNVPDLADWPTGVYLWKVKAGKDKLEGRFVKN